MPCCKLGCSCEEHELIGERSIALRTKNNSLHHVEIQWCKEHTPDCILKEIKKDELLNKWGY